MITRASDGMQRQDKKRYLLLANQRLQQFVRKEGEKRPLREEQCYGSFDDNAGPTDLNRWVKSGVGSTLTDKGGFLQGFDEVGKDRWR